MKYLSGNRRQSGVALLVALVFLLVITLIAVNAVRFTSVGVRSALNDEYRASSFINAQSLIEATIAVPDNTPVTTGTGQIYCTTNLSCTNKIITMPAGTLTSQVTANTASVQVTRLEPELAPPPRGSGASLNKFFGANFQVQATHDETAAGHGRTQVNEGLILIINRN